MDFRTTLALIKAQYLHQNHLPSGAAYNKLVVGAIIFHPTSAVPKLLLVKRAAHEIAFPNVFEIPGGKVDDEDASILDGLKREVREETALTFETVSGMTDSFDYAMEKTVTVEGEEEVVVRQMSMQLNFVCGVKEEMFRVDPNEHSEGVWATKEEVEDLAMTVKMRMVVEKAFLWSMSHNDVKIQ